MNNYYYMTIDNITPVLSGTGIGQVIATVPRISVSEVIRKIKF